MFLEPTVSKRNLATLARRGQNPLVSQVYYVFNDYSYFINDTVMVCKHLLFLLYKHFKMHKQLCDVMHFYYFVAADVCEVYSDLTEKRLKKINYAQRLIFFLFDEFLHKNHLFSKDLFKTEQ